MTIKTLNDKCNMTCENFMNHPMCMCERRIIISIAKNPHLINLLDRNSNHALIGKYSHILFNN